MALERTPAFAGGVTPAVAVADQVRRLLSSAPVTVSYRAALEAALALPGNMLSDTPNARWAKQVWTCCVAVGGRWEQAVEVAAAVEIFMVALDVLDDVEDGEDTSLRGHLGAARTLNVSTGLLFLAQWSLLNMAEGGAAAANMLLKAGLEACGGQHADLGTGSPRPVSPEEALEVTAGKSASLVAAICRLGACAAGADMTMQERYARFGWCVGMVAQLANDIKAIHPNAIDKTDIALGRPTLPLAYAASYGAAGAGADDVDIRTALWTGGAAYLTWAVAETYRRHALGMLPQLASDPSRQADLAALLSVLS